jgi:hypothetical protein
MSKLIEKIKGKSEGGSGLTQGSKFPTNLGLLKEDSVEKGTVDINELKGKSALGSASLPTQDADNIEISLLRYQELSAPRALIKCLDTSSTQSSLPRKAFKGYMLLRSTTCL